MYMYRGNAVSAYLALHLPNLQLETPLQPKIYGCQCGGGCFTAPRWFGLLRSKMPVLIGWVVISFTCLYQFHLSALVIQPGRRLPMPFVGATSQTVSTLTTEGNSSTASEDTTLPSTEAKNVTTGFLPSTSPTILLWLLPQPVPQLANIILQQQGSMW